MGTYSISYRCSGVLSLQRTSWLIISSARGSIYVVISFERTQLIQHRIASVYPPRGLILTCGLHGMVVDDWRLYHPSRSFCAPLPWWFQESLCTYESTFKASSQHVHATMCQRRLTGRWNTSSNSLEIGQYPPLPLLLLLLFRLHQLLFSPFEWHRKPTSVLCGRFWECRTVFVPPLLGWIRVHSRSLQSTPLTFLSVTYSQSIIHCSLMNPTS